MEDQVDLEQTELDRLLKEYMSARGSRQRANRVVIDLEKEKSAWLGGIGAAGSAVGAGIGAAAFTLSGQPFAFSLGMNIGLFSGKLVGSGVEDYYKNWKMPPALEKETWAIELERKVTEAARKVGQSSSIETILQVQGKLQIDQEANPLAQEIMITVLARESLKQGNQLSDLQDELQQASTLMGAYFSLGAGQPEEATRQLSELERLSPRLKQQAEQLKTQAGRQMDKEAFRAWNSTASFISTLGGWTKNEPLMKVGAVAQEVGRITHTVRQIKDQKGWEKWTSAMNTLSLLTNLVGLFIEQQDDIYQQLTSELERISGDMLTHRLAIEDRVSKEATWTRTVVLAEITQATQQVQTNLGAIRARQQQYHYDIKDLLTTLRSQQRADHQLLFRLVSNMDEGLQVTLRGVVTADTDGDDYFFNHLDGMSFRTHLYRLKAAVNERRFPIASPSKTVDDQLIYYSDANDRGGIYQERSWLLLANGKEEVNEWLPIINAIAEPTTWIACMEAMTILLQRVPANQHHYQFPADQKVQIRKNAENYTSLFTKLRERFSNWLERAAHANYVRCWRNIQQSFDSNVMAVASARVKHAMLLYQNNVNEGVSRYSPADWKTELVRSIPMIDIENVTPSSYDRVRSEISRKEGADAVASVVLSPILVTLLGGLKLLGEGEKRTTTRQSAYDLNNTQGYYDAYVQFVSQHALYDGAEAFEQDIRGLLVEALQEEESGLRTDVSSERIAKWFLPARFMTYQLSDDRNIVLPIPELFSIELVNFFRKTRLLHSCLFAGYPLSLPACSLSEGSQQANKLPKQRATYNIKLTVSGDVFDLGHFAASYPVDAPKRAGSTQQQTWKQVLNQLQKNNIAVEMLALFKQLFLQVGSAFDISWASVFETGKALQDPPKLAFKEKGESQCSREFIASNVVKMQSAAVAYLLDPPDDPEIAEALGKSEMALERRLLIGSKQALNGKRDQLKLFSLQLSSLLRSLGLELDRVPYGDDHVDLILNSHRTMLATYMPEGISSVLLNGNEERFTAEAKTGIPLQDEKIEEALPAFERAVDSSVHADSAAAEKPPLPEGYAGGNQGMYRRPPSQQAASSAPRGRPHAS